MRHPLLACFALGLAVAAASAQPQAAHERYGTPEEVSRALARTEELLKTDPGNVQALYERG